MTTEIQRSDANGLSYARAFNSRQEAEIWALAAFGRSLPGVTFHETFRAHALRCHEERTALSSPQFRTKTQQRLHDAESLAQRIAVELKFLHGSPFSYPHALGCGTCQLIAEAKG